MAKVSLYLDMRAVKSGQPGPLKVKYFHRGKTIFLPTSIKLMPDQLIGNTIVNREARNHDFGRTQEKTHDRHRPFYRERK